MSTALTEQNRDFSLVVRLPDLARSLRLYLFQERLEVLPAEAAPDHDIQVTAETLCFLLRNKFGRGTLSINSRIQFNYPSAHRFFIFFFIPYANNIGRYFQEDRLDAAQLESIARTSVMMSILKASPAAVHNLAADLRTFA